ncbi:hypothetical protein FCH28_30485 [Streptomyces piniterrae]|uniref:Uncharacterized protein n=1 Tax=Streptomyces piniterrae TaxID=2571125 RepID=A0A4U0N4V1_9ACTN|nr:hypothetical protein [Streptomyces piniterrae]TJZ44634.1 hypothetical protein FCH28_30485 [Streptomyces piniterrae]
MRTPLQAERAVRGGPGSFHVPASVAGRMCVRGTAGGQRRLFHLDVGGVRMVADRARTLARLTGAGVDVRQVAAGMASLVAPAHPLDQLTMFEGVHALAPGQAMDVDGAGRGTVRAW